MLSTSYPAPAVSDHQLPVWAYKALAFLAACMGLVAAAITTQFFVLGLERTETDLTARTALVAAGALMVAVELFAFGVAALLPRKVVRAARHKLVLLGVALLAFEASTLYVTQVALVRTSQAETAGTATRITQLQESISAQRAAAATIRDSAAKQAQSRYAWIRESGAKQAAQALHAEQIISDQVVELARLQAAARPTLADTLGNDGMIFYAVCRSLLLVLVGVVLFGVAGALLRAGRDASLSVQGACATSTAADSGPLPVMRSVGGRFAAAPLAALAAGPSAFAQPVVTVQAIHPHTLGAAVMETPVLSSTETTPAPTYAQRAAVTNAALQDSGTGEANGARYHRVRADILAGTIKPSLRAVYAAHGATQAVARRYLAAMEEAGEIRRSGQGYVLAGDDSWASTDASV
ncbi:conserved membrane hypothetical protein [Cupriavidus taiwanensis]|nr:conserved membrane hypothetical protein [Cupriavidus taiwanensis]